MRLASKILLFAVIFSAGIVVGTFQPGLEMTESQPATNPITTRSDLANQQLDILEARLHQTQASVSFWDQLATRRKKIAVITCENAEKHAKGILLHLSKNHQH
jgi:hypothetical protein